MAIDPNLYYNRGMDLGGAYEAGQDATAARNQLATSNAIKNRDNSAIADQNTSKAAQDALTLKQNSGLDTDAQQMYGAAGSTPPPAAGAPNFQAPTATGTPADTSVTGAASDIGSGGAPSGMSAPPPGAQTPGPGGMNTNAAAPAPPVPPALKALQDKQANAVARTAALGRAGNFVASEKARADAEGAAQEISYTKGALAADNPEAWEQAAKMVSQQSKSVSVGKDSHGRDMLSIVEPNGTTTFHTLTAVDKKNMLGAGQMMKDGYVQQALGVFAKVDANLAAAVNANNKAQETVSGANNKTAHEEAEDDNGRMRASAEMMRASTERTKQSFGPPIKTVDDKGEASYVQPVMVNGKVSYDKIDLPAGSHFPNEKAALTMTKTDNGVVASDHSGNVMWKTDAEGNPSPAEHDIFAGKSGQKTQADFESKGVTRGTIQDKAGKLHWGYTSSDDPSGSAWPTPQAALAAGAKAKAANAPGPDMEDSDTMKNVYSTAQATKLEQDKNRQIAESKVRAQAARGGLKED